MDLFFTQLFYLKRRTTEKSLKVPIYLRLTVNGQRSELSISRKIDPEKWNSRIGRMMGSSIEAMELNKYLDSITNMVNKAHSRLADENKPFHPQI